MIFRKLMCAVLAISFLLLPLNSTAEMIVEQPVFLEDVQVEVTENKYNKFHFYFGTEEHETIDSAEELEAAVEGVFEEAAEPVNYLLAENAVATIYELAVTVRFKNEFESTKIYQDFCEERLHLKDISEARSFRQRLNTYSKQYHAELVASNLDSLSNLGYTSYEAIGYTPYVLLEMPTQNLELNVLENIAEEERIVDISFAHQVDADAVIAEEIALMAGVAPTVRLSWDDMLREMNAFDIIENGTYTGNNIYIGVLETEGICEKEHQNLDGKLITFENPDAEISDHATQVTSILASLAPDASFFVEKKEKIT